MFIPCFSPKTAVKIQYFSTNLKTLNIDPYSRTQQKINFSAHPASVPFIQIMGFESIIIYFKGFKGFNCYSNYDLIIFPYLM